MSPVWKAPPWPWTRRRGWRWFGMRFSSLTRRSSRHKRYCCIANCCLWFCHQLILLKTQQLAVINLRSSSRRCSRRRSRRCLRTWCRLSTQTLSSSTNTGLTWRRLRHGWVVFFFFNLQAHRHQAHRITLPHCKVAADILAASLAYPSSNSFLRSYSSQSTCHQGASSSSWRKPRRTTRPWTSRSVTVVHLHGALQQHRSRPYLPKRLWVI